MFFGDETFNIITEPDTVPVNDKVDPPTGGGPTNKWRKDVATFHTFMLMNIFNMINCRVVNQHQDNVFKTLFNNKIFWFIFIVELAAQYGMVLSGEIKEGPFKFVP